MQLDTLRLTLIKLGVRVRERIREVSGVWDLIYTHLGMLVS